MKWLSLSECAKELQITHQALSKAIREGRITNVRREKNRVMVSLDEVRGVIGVEPGMDSAPSLDELRTWKVHEQKYRALLAELRYRQEEGTLINIDNALRSYEDAALRVRNNLLALPNKLAPRIHDAGSASEVRDLLDKAIRDSIEDINRPTEKLGPAPIPVE